jgi:peptidoglycan/LPS O-acetylase OafA/YrhL
VASTQPTDGRAPFRPTSKACLVLAGVAIAGGLRQPLNAPPRLIAIGPMRWIGGISCSLYPNLGD